MAGYRDSYPARPPRYRYLRSFIPFFLSLGLLAFLLTSLGLLSHYRSPAAKQQIGWQSWDIVRVEKEGKVEGEESEDGSEGANDGWGWDWGDLGYSLPLENWVS